MRYQHKQYFEIYPLHRCLAADGRSDVRVEQNMPFPVLMSDLELIVKNQQSFLIREDINDQGFTLSLVHFNLGATVIGYSFPFFQSGFKKLQGEAKSQKSTSSFLDQSTLCQRQIMPRTIKLQVLFQLNLILKRSMTTIIIIIRQKKNQMLKQVPEMILPTEQSSLNAQLEKGSAESQNTRENNSISICSCPSLQNNNFVNKIVEQAISGPEEGQSKAGLEGNSIETYKMLIEQILRNKSKPIQLQKQPPQDHKKEPPRKNLPIFKEITLEHYLSNFLRELREVRPRLVDLFHSYLSSDKKIYRFLQHLYYSYPIETVSQLLKYEFYIWELYYPYLGSSLTILQAEGMGLKISQRIVAGIVEAREKRNLQKLDGEYLLNLMMTLAQATIFIMEDFEMDSLMQQQSSRRPQGEQEENSNPRKMIKQNQ